ncbi:MAG: aminodeoxychorismate lyase [Rhizobiales bacterium 65-9]|nr:endolytic transglycosylase MltG [Hyphomicrobiales bacterium]OJY37639.1 MAG: aminodeoxychorismate lyase [Rhizobiales bacterium 65-9]
MTDGYSNTDAASVARQASAEPRRGAPRSPIETMEPQAAPPPPPRLKMRHRPIVTFGSNMFTILLLLIAVAGAGAYFVVREVERPGPLQSDKVLSVRGGVWDIAEQLAQEGVIASPYAFMFTHFTRSHGEHLKAGEYMFKPRMTIPQVVSLLLEGKSILHSISIPEGLTSEQIVGRLVESDVLTGEIRETPPEGSLLPDTYRVERGMSRSRLIAQMQEGQRKALNEIWARRSPEIPVRSARELVVLASIVEKETGRADERPRVAGVFINRINKRMKLQSDPTIVYGLVGGRGTLGRGITRAEIDRATPYNTYVIEGLPPGPIANPGRAAMEAVANPSRTKDLYFVADGTGGHVFAETLDQHNRNVVRWRQVERARANPDEKPVDRFEDDSVAPPAAGQPPLRGGSDATGASGRRAGADVAPLAGGRVPVTDASEGTSFDPLKNKTFDLNSPKTVPALPR